MRVGLGPGTDLLGNIHTLLHGDQLGHQFGHVVAGLDGLQGALLHGLLHHDGLDPVVTDDGTLPVNCQSFIIYQLQRI